MKALIDRSVLVGTIGLLAAAAVQAQTWTTLFEGEAGTTGNAILVDTLTASEPAPDLLVAGRTGDGEEFLRISPDGSAESLNVSGVRTRKLFVDPNTGYLFGVGYTVYDTVFAWNVLRSTDAGITWTAVRDAYQYKPGANANARGFAADSQGNIYVTGNVLDSARSGAKQYWLVEKSSDNGNSWKRVAFVQSQGQGSADAAHFVPGPEGGLFVVGRLGEKWTVQRSRDAGETWTTVDSWVPRKSSIAGALAIASDNARKVYVFGAPGRTWEPWEWVVRTSSDAGTTWQTDLRYATGPVNWPGDLAIDSEGNVYAVGSTHHNGKAAWTVRRRDAATGQWDKWDLTAPDLRWPFGTAGVVPSRASGISIAVTGNLYITGNANDLQGNNHWIVQRLMISE